MSDEPRSNPISRRNFVGTGLTAAALWWTRRTLYATTPQPSAGPRIGIIGCGARGAGAHVPLSLVAGAEIRALCDVIPARAGRAADRVQQETGERPAVYTNGDRHWRDMLARDDLDAVIIATPWEWHTQMGVAAMQAGVVPGIEVPAAITLEECWNLVDTSEQTQVPCMMLENVCYFRPVMALRNKIRAGDLGELVYCQSGYRHHILDEYLTKTWRGDHHRTRNGCLYPTHQVGPVAQMMDIHHGDLFDHIVSMSAEATIFPDGMGDINHSFIRTHKGRMIMLAYDTLLPRPYELGIMAQGKTALHRFLGTQELASTLDDDLDLFDDPLWQTYAADATQAGALAHGGGDYIMLREFFRAVQNGTQTPQTVYDAAAWSSIFALSIDSVQAGSAPQRFPDFTRGKSAQPGWEQPGVPAFAFLAFLDPRDGAGAIDFIGSWQYMVDGDDYVRTFLPDGRAQLYINGTRSPVWDGFTWSVSSGQLTVWRNDSQPDGTMRLIHPDLMKFETDPWPDACRIPPEAELTGMHRSGNQVTLHWNGPTETVRVFSGPNLAGPFTEEFGGRITDKTWAKNWSTEDAIPRYFFIQTEL